MTGDDHIAEDVTRAGHGGKTDEESMVLRRAPRKG